MKLDLEGLFHSILDEFVIPFFLCSRMSERQLVAAGLPFNSDIGHDMLYLRKALPQAVRTFFGPGLYWHKAHFIG